MATATPITQPSQAQATQSVNKMYDDGDKFMQRWNAMVALAPHVKGTPLAAKYADIMAKGAKVRSVIDSAHSKIKAAYDSAGESLADAWQWVKNKVGLNGVDGADDVGMGLLPLIPIAYVALSGAAVTASVAMLNWSQEADGFIAVYNDMVKRGVDPTVAAGTLSQNVGGGAPQKSLLERMGLPSTDSLGKVALIGGAIFLLGKWRKWW